MSKIPYLAAVLTASSLAFAIPSAAQDHHGAAAMHEMHGGPGGMHFLRQLDLTEEQRDQAFKIFHDQAPALRERMKAVRSAHQELRKAALAPSFDGGRVRQLADAVAKAHADAAVMHAETMSRVVALLTPEQRARLEESRARSGSRYERH